MNRRSFSLSGIVAALASVVGVRSVKAEYSPESETGVPLRESDFMPGIEFDTASGETFLIEYPHRNPVGLNYVLNIASENYYTWCRIGQGDFWDRYMFPDHYLHHEIRSRTDVVSGGNPGDPPLGNSDYPSWNRAELLALRSAIDRTLALPVPEHLRANDPRVAERSTVNRIDYEAYLAS
jgi:hypothetical protein